MNTTTNLLGILSLSALMTIGCSKGDDKSEDKGTAAKTTETAPKKEKAPEKPIELSAKLDVGAAISDVDETRYKGITLSAPAGSKMNDNSGMALTLEFGEKSFEMRFEFDDEGAVAKAKTEATAGNGLDKLVKFHVDQADGVLWESSSELGGENNFSFVATVKIGEKNLLCKNKGYGQFSLNEATALMKSCQSATR